MEKRVSGPEGKVIILINELDELAPAEGGEAVRGFAEFLRL